MNLNDLQFENDLTSVEGRILNRLEYLQNKHKTEENNPNSDLLRFQKDRRELLKGYRLAEQNEMEFLNSLLSDIYENKKYLDSIFGAIKGLTGK